MGQVTNVLPTTMSLVKSSGIGSSQNSMRAYLIGGAAGVNSNTAGHLGFIPSSGTVNLSRFRDATRANLSSGTSITGSVSYRIYSSGAASATTTATFSAGGVLTVSTSGDGEPQGSSTSSHPNQWLIRTASVCLANTCGNWEIKLMKTGGNGAAPTNNNTWVALSTSRTLTVSAFSSGGGGSVTTSLQANVQIRRLDTGVVVMMTNASISATADSSSSAPP